VINNQKQHKAAQQKSLCITTCSSGKGLVHPMHKISIVGLV